MDAVSLLKQDHEQVAALFESFEGANEDDKTLLAGQICQLLTVHVRIEEQLLYPAARGVLDVDDETLVDEATVEHSTVKGLVGQIERLVAGDDLFDAKVKVLGEYVAHHVREEEGSLFPKLAKAGLDLNALGEALATRKAELMIELGISEEDAVEPEELPEDSRATLESRPRRNGGATTH